MKNGSLIALLIVIAVLFDSPVPCSALVAMPKDAGIDYGTLKVTDASKLKVRGMKKVEVGDIVTVGPAENGGLLVTNKRTGEKIKWDYSK